MGCVIYGHHKRSLKYRTVTTQVGQKHVNKKRGSLGSFTACPSESVLGPSFAMNRLLPQIGQAEAQARSEGRSTVPRAENYFEDEEPALG